MEPPGPCICSGCPRVHRAAGWTAASNARHAHLQFLLIFGGLGKQAVHWQGKPFLGEKVCIGICTQLTEEESHPRAMDSHAAQPSSHSDVRGLLACAAQGAAGSVVCQCSRCAVFSVIAP